MAEHNVVWHDGLVSRADRNLLNNHKSGVIWTTGLSASGKSTLVHHVERRLFDLGVRTYVLDGDNVRHGINANLGFSKEDRKENLRRVAELAKLFVDAGVLVLTAFISPFREDRDYIRSRFETDDYLEIYMRCPLAICETRDPKGLYKKARAGEIRDYTGISSPYEEPETPDLIIDSDVMGLDESIDGVLDLLKNRRFITL
ncbi:MAG: adenylyl-sulfate kinase [Nitrospirae bacterium]|nr:adenylyl-sulfate kinase [Nitrospirota bacterium]